MNIDDLASSPAVTCRPDTAITQVARAMAESDVGAIVVVDEADHLIGIVTDRDLVVRALAQDLAPTTPVERVMTHDVVHVLATADASAAPNQMAAWGIRRLPVLDPDGTVRGLVSLDDLMLVYSEEVDAAVRPVRREVRFGRRGIPLAADRPPRRPDLRRVPSGPNVDTTPAALTQS